jgi:TatD DNase family protein
MLIDTHCHLDPAYFPDGADSVLSRAKAIGVSAFVVVGVGTDLGPARHAVRLAEQRPDVYAAIGVHPHDASRFDDDMLSELDRLADSPRVVAIGEIGLDYHYLHSPKDAQIATFRRLIELARAKRKPIVIHTREARAETLAILEESRARDVGGIIHCFSEDKAFAERALDLDFDLSFSGIVTFKSARSVHEVAAWAPADRILVETDSPYLAPVPFRGKTCEPAFVTQTARRVAELRGARFEDVCRQTSLNAAKRLRLRLPENAD